MLCWWEHELVLVRTDKVSNVTYMYRFFLLCLSSDFTGK